MEEAAGILLGLLLAAISLNYISGGWDGVKAWLAAKFLGKPTAAPAAAKPR